MKTTKSFIVILFALLTAQAALAWYDPSTQRWLTRDPIGEPGFETLRLSTTAPQIGIQLSSPSARWITRDLVGKIAGPNLYEFVQNRPTMLHDANGLIAFPACEAARKAFKIAQDAYLADPDNQAALEAYQAAFVAMIAACTPPPEMPPSSPNCPVMPQQPNNPYQNNQGSYCASHPAICRAIGITVVGVAIGVGILTGVCEVCPLCCAAPAF